MKKWNRLLVLLTLLQMLSAALYLGNADGFGFPLDDAWIHQTYARNLGLHGLMAFSPGQPSTGSTSFGWTILLAAGYFLNIPFFIWTYVWGGMFAVATAFVAAYLSLLHFENLKSAVFVAVICILEWHLAWSSVSGMEIGLFTFLTLLFFLLLPRGASPVVLGGLTGLIVLVRPEGILLALLYGSSLLLTSQHETKRILSHVAPFLLAFLIVISPWIVFNYSYSHRPFPNTISAKFMQYGYPWSLWKSLRYLWDVLIYFLNGPLLLLVPGAGLAVYQAVKTKSNRLLLPVAWLLSLIGLYAVALPAIYDHGRYLMPLIPLVIVFGVEGLVKSLQRFVQSHVLRSAVWIILLGMIVVLWINGASDYGFRIRLFNTVHLPAAHWTNANIPPDAVIATHDIGIIGYHTQREIVDLAGLITSEIVPIMGNPQELANYLRARQVTYLMVYSGYYRELLEILSAQVVYSPGAEQLRAMHIEPFEIYKVGGR